MEVVLSSTLITDLALPSGESSIQDSADAVSIEKILPQIASVFEESSKLSGDLKKQKSPSSREEEKEQQENILMDFSATFKSNTRGFKGKKSKKGVVASKVPFQEQLNKEGLTTPESDLNIKMTGGPNMDLEDQNKGKQVEICPQEIPRNLKITQAEMGMRKVMDQRRWFAIARPQHPKSCGISSLTSTWNFLFSTLGAGKLRPISTEEALEVLGFLPPYTDVNFGSFTGNDTLIQWFGLLNRYFNVKGRAAVSWKVHGNNKTQGIDSDQALDNLTAGLRNEKKGYIYHCWNHYFCPVGFEQTPSKPYQAYSQMKDIAELDTWIIIGEVSKCYPVFHVKKWEDIVTDINCAFPKYFNIRKTELGIQEKVSKAFVDGSKLGGNLHCLIEFEALN